MIVGGQTEAHAQLSSTIIDYHEPFDQGFKNANADKRSKIGKLYGPDQTPYITSHEPNLMTVSVDSNNNPPNACLIETQTWNLTQSNRAATLNK